jgi:hypothetical protein
MYRVDEYYDNMGTCLGFAETLRSAESLFGKKRKRMKVTSTREYRSFGQITKFKFPKKDWDDLETITFEETLNKCWGHADADIVETIYYK